MQENLVKMDVYIIWPRFIIYLDDGKEDVKRVSNIFFPNNSLSFLKSVEVKR